MNFQRIRLAHHYSASQRMHYYVVSNEFLFIGGEHDRTFAYYADALDHVNERVEVLENNDWIVDTDLCERWHYKQR